MADGIRHWNLKRANVSLREKCTSETPLAWVERDQKAWTEIGGTQLAGPIHLLCPPLNGPHGDKVWPSWPGARHIPEKKIKMTACRALFVQIGDSSHKRHAGSEWGGGLGRGEDACLVRGLSEPLIKG